MYLSYVVFTGHEVSLPEHGLVLDTGSNTFTVEVPDVAAFDARLAQEGVRVIQKHRLDEHEPVEPVTSQTGLLPV